jgi:hypothetical protein
MRWIQEEEEDQSEAGDVAMGDAGEEGEVAAVNVSERNVVHATYRDEKEMARAGHKYLRTTLKKGGWVLQVIVCGSSVCI